MKKKVFYLGKNYQFIKNRDRYSFCIKNKTNYILYGDLYIYTNGRIYFDVYSGVSRYFDYIEELFFYPPLKVYVNRNWGNNAIEEFNNFLLEHYGVKLTEEFRELIMCELILNKLT